MKTSDIFDGLLQNLKVGDSSIVIAARRDEITKALNKAFRGKVGSTGHKLMIGSYGRHTAIRAISDLDMIYILPASLRVQYAGETGPRRALERVRDTLTKRYPNTIIRVDQCVVRVQFSNFRFEVQPAFENDDDSFDYPDTLYKNWRVTKPRAEINETKACNERTSGNMRKLARVARAWKNANGVNMGGLLIDTLVHSFFASTDDYDTGSTEVFDLMARDFFLFLASQPDQDYYRALGSKQRVNVKARFQPKAKKAHKRCLEAIALAGKAAANRKWREVFGTQVPLDVKKQADSFHDTEEFIEDRYPVDICEVLTIECAVTQDGWRPSSLREMLRAKTVLLPHKDLDFTISGCSVESPYQVRWKVLNRGEEAERRNQIRGQIIESTRAYRGIRERTQFRGNHLVECYIVKDGVVVARDLIDVPIAGNGG